MIIKNGFCRHIYGTKVYGAYFGCFPAITDIILNFADVMASRGYVSTTALMSSVLHGATSMALADVYRHTIIKVLLIRHLDFILLDNEK